MSKFSKAIRHLGGKTDKAANWAADKTVNGAVRTSKLASRAAFNKVDKSVFNGYTGLKTGAFTTAGAFGVAGLWGSATYEPTLAKKGMEAVPTEYVGQAPVQNYDGVGNGTAPTLGASGNMVFGLHNSRKG
jgi:hypothetical protein